MAYQGTDPVYWISQHDSIVSLPTMSLGRRCRRTMLSVIIDSDLRKRFSGVRITMAALDIEWDKHSHLLNEITIELSLDYQRVSTIARPDKPLQCELLHLALTLNPEQLIRGIGSVTIVKLLPPVVPGISAEVSLPKGRILFDSVLLAPQPNTGINVWIESTIGLAFRDIIYHPGYTGHLSFHVFPIQRGLHTLSPHTDQGSKAIPINKLPNNLIALIARQAIRPEPFQLVFGGSSQSSTGYQYLLDCSLVQKSWKPLLKHLFSLVGIKDQITKPELLARSLEVQPSLRSCVTAFNIQPKMSSDSDWENWMRLDFLVNKGYLNLLRMTASSLTTIRIPYDLLHPLKDQLAQLSHVRVCKLTGWGSAIPHDGVCPVNFATMLHVIQHWSQLGTLRIAPHHRRPRLAIIPGNDSSAPNQLSTTPLSELPTMIPFSLEELHLRGVDFTSKQIMPLISSSRNTLRRLSLSGTEALSDIDIYNIVALIHRNIEVLQIEGYHIKSPSFNDRGHKLIDTLIPEMQHIQKLHITRSLITPAAIGLKPRCSTAVQKTQDNCSTPTIDQCCRIEIPPFGDSIARCWSADSVLEAMETTGWGEIFIGGLCEKADGKRLGLLAKKRRINLNLYAYINEPI